MTGPDYPRRTDRPTTLLWDHLAFSSDNERDRSAAASAAAGSS